MSEHKYEFGDPVEVKLDQEWFQGVYLRPHSQNPCVRLAAFMVDGKYADEFFEPDRIRPRTVAPARTGWRLPERGDVVRITNPGHEWHGKDVFVELFSPTGTCPIHCSLYQGGPRRCFMFCHVEMVGLHDAPPETPAPAAKTGKVIPETKRKRCLEYLASLQLGREQDEFEDDDAIGQLGRDIELAMIDYIAKTLAGGAA